MPTPGTLEFPTALDGVVSLFEVNNRAYTTLSADINNSVLAIPLTDSTVFPATGVVTLTDSLTAPTKHEEIIYTANAANSLTVPVGGRGAFGSTAQNWSGTVYVRMRMIAEHHEVVRDAVIQLETKLGYGSATPTDGKFLVGNTTAGTSTWRVLASGDIPDLSGTYQPLDSDLTAIAGLSPSNDDIIQRKAGAWTNRTMAQLKADLSLNNVENTALSTWAGSANITTLGTVATGVWNGSVIGSNYGGAGAINGILKANGSGVVSAAVAGTDYLSATAPGSSGQLLYNNANAYAGATGFNYNASGSGAFITATQAANTRSVFSVHETGATLVDNGRVAGSPTLLSLVSANGATYYSLGYINEAAGKIANYISNDAQLQFDVYGPSDNYYGSAFFLRYGGVGVISASGTQEGGFYEYADSKFALGLVTSFTSGGSNSNRLTWGSGGVTIHAPATALADGDVAANHLHFYQDEATNELKAKWKESGGSVNTITFGSGGASNPFDDATAIIKGSADPTKLLRIEVDGLTAGTTRVWTAPDANLTVAGIDLAQTWTANQTFTSGVTTGTGSSSGTVFTYNSLTTGEGAYFSSNSVTSGSIVSIASTSTAAASSTLTGLRIAMSGANASSAQSVYGQRISVTNTNATSGTNIALELTASGATTANVALNVAGGQIRVPNGSASAPSYSFSGATNSGMFVANTNQPYFSSNGTTVAGFSTTELFLAAGLRINFGSSAFLRGTSAVITLGAADVNGTPVAQTLSVQNATTGTNLAGSTWTMRASLGTGNAVPGRLHLAAGAMSATSGTTQQTAIDRGVIGATKVLTNNSAITITNVTVASNSNAGGQIGYLIEVTDGTDFQYETGVVSFGVTNKGGVFSGNTCTKFGNHQNATSGTLTVTFAISGANPALLSCNANSSLTPSTGFPRITYWLMNESQQAIAIQ